MPNSVGALVARLRGLLKRRPPVRVVLDPAEQCIVLHLLRTGRATQGEVLAAVAAERPTTPEQQVRLSLLRLESLRLIAREAPPPATAGSETPAGERVYHLTADGRRLRRAIPPDPRSTIEIRL